MWTMVDLVEKGGEVFLVIITVSVVGWFCALRGLLLRRGVWLRFSLTLASVAPLLGLLGTVRGMMRAFEAIQTHGAGEVGLLAGGVSEALLTTEAGLITALPLLLLSRWGLWRLSQWRDHARRNHNSP